MDRLNDNIDVKFVEDNDELVKNAKVVPLEERDTRDHCVDTARHCVASPDRPSSLALSRTSSSSSLAASDVSAFSTAECQLQQEDVQVQPMHESTESLNRAILLAEKRIRKHSGAKNKCSSSSENAKASKIGHPQQIPSLDKNELLLLLPENTTKAPVVDNCTTAMNEQQDSSSTGIIRGPNLKKKTNFPTSNSSTMDFFRRHKSEGCELFSRSTEDEEDINLDQDQQTGNGDHQHFDQHYPQNPQGQCPAGDTMAYPADLDNIFVDALTPTIDKAPAVGGHKRSQTEQVINMQTLKTKLSKYTAYVDEHAWKMISDGSDRSLIEGCKLLTKVMTKAWACPHISRDLAFSLCDHLRENSYLDKLIRLFINPNTSDKVRLSCGRVLEECLSQPNREYIVSKGHLKRLALTTQMLNRTGEQQRMSISIIESLFKHSSSTCDSLLELGVLDHILLICKRAKVNQQTTLRHAALALANLSLYSCSEGKRNIVQKRVPDWLFLLASQPDPITRYYASRQKEMEMAVSKSGTLALVQTFLSAHSPDSLALADYKHSQGRSKDWLNRLMPMLRSQCPEAKSIAAYHFVMECTIKKNQGNLQLFQEIGAIDALRQTASSPQQIAADFASQALIIIGESLPYKLSQQVPNWSVEDVHYWITKIGFEQYADIFTNNMVDGDLLLLLSEKELEEDIRMNSCILRKRFIRELDSLKRAADYSSLDDSHLDQFLMSVAPELSVYTYRMLSTGLKRHLLPSLTDDMLKCVCGIANPVHRLSLRQALQGSNHIEDVEVALLSKQIDVFISYRRSTGNQLASLIKVLLQLRGYKVFIDVERLTSGKFDSSLLKNIKAAKHFILVLTRNSLDRLLGDSNCDDWVHKELLCAFEHDKNVIPIFDPQFEFPAKVEEIPSDIRPITRYNGVRWVHEYQDACVDKLERFIKSQYNRSLCNSQSLDKPMNSVQHNLPHSPPASFSTAKTADHHLISGEVKSPSYSRNLISGVRRAQMTISRKQSILKRQNVQFMSP